jgi:hypothetical protein
MKKSLTNRAVKITVVSILTFSLYFNFGIETESGKSGVPSFKSITFGNIAFAQEDEEAPDDDVVRIAPNCKYTGYHRDHCSYGNYSISNCRKKTTIMETSDCGYTP